MTTLAKYVNEFPNKSYRLEKIINSFIVNEDTLEEDIDSLYKILFDKKFQTHNKLIFSVFNLIRNNIDLLNISKLFEITNISKKLFKKIFKNEVETVFFPIVNENTAEMAKAYLIETEENFTFNKEFENDLKNISKICNKKFFIIFDRDFVGKSFMLAVCAGLILTDKTLEKYSFTGEVLASGEIKDVRFIDKKKKISEENNLILISPKQIENIEDLKLLEVEEYNLPFVQLFGKQELETNFSRLEKFEGLIDFKKILKIYDLKIYDLSLYYKEFLPLKESFWEKFLDEFINKIDFLYKKFPNLNLHICGSLASFMFAAGIVLGAKKKFCLYHFQDNEFFKVLDLCNNSTRKIKAKYDSYKLIKARKELDNNSNELSVIIYLASHNPINDAKNYIKQNLKTNILIVESAKKQGELSVNKPEEWIEIVAEIYSAIDGYQNEENVKIDKYHFFMSIPVPLATALGMAIGDYKEISIYQHNKSNQTYYEVLNSKKCKGLRNLF